MKHFEKISQKPKAIIFDAFGVLLSNGIFITAEKMSKKYFKDSQDFWSKFEVWREFWQQLWLGNITKKDVESKISKDVGSKLATEFFKGWIIYSNAYPEMIQLLKGLKKANKYKLCLLSNVPKFKYDHIIKKEIPVHLFDEIVVSYKVHLMKPNTRFYKIMIDKLDVKAEECLFIDDDLNNIKGARKARMRAFHFSNYSGLLKYLKSSDIL